jgi:hypothetical protein
MPSVHVHALDFLHATSHAVACFDLYSSISSNTLPLLAISKEKTNNAVACWEAQEENGLVPVTAVLTVALCCFLFL